LEMLTMNKNQRETFVLNAVQVFQLQQSSAQNAEQRNNKKNNFLIINFRL